MKLITLYKALLELGGMSADRDGFVSGKLPGSTKEASPVTIKGKRLVLPTQKQLTTADWSDRIVFHPLYENVLRGESQVIEKLRSLITMRINVCISILGTGLLELASNTDEHSKLNPDQSMFLAKVRMLDKNILEGWAGLCKATDLADGKQNFVHVFLKRSGVVGGKKHARVGVVNFPVMKALVNDETVFSYKLRNKAHREVFKNLLEFIFKDILNDGAYNAGSDSSIAPYTDAMLRAFLNVIAPLNDTIDLFSDIRPELADLRFGVDWVEELDKLEGYHVDIRAIPMQAGNEGTTLVKGVAPAEEAQVPEVQAPAPTPAPTPTPTQAPAPVHNWQNPAPAATNYQFPQNQFTPNAATGAPPGMMYHPTMGWIPATPVQAPVAAGVHHSRDGADFGSILQSNPTLAMAAAAFAHPQQFGMAPNQQQSIPRFAQTPVQQMMGNMGGMSGGMGMGMGMGGGYGMPNMNAGMGNPII